MDEMRDGFEEDMEEDEIDALDEEENLLGDEDDLEDGDDDEKLLQDRFSVTDEFGNPEEEESDL